MKRSYSTLKLSLSLSSLALTLLACSSASNALEINADIWADNWFALYQGEELIKEDSTAFNTERSFNSESFSFSADLPATFNVIMKDFYEDDSGLEYIGSRRQQMGDGGFIAQFFDAESGDLIAVSDDSWRCTVIHQAPLNKQCSGDNNPIETCQSNISEQPEGWMAEDFDVSGWPQATVHSARTVRPHGGYRNVNWVSDAELIWGEDVEVDNVLLCRFTIDAP